MQTPQPDSSTRALILQQTLALYKFCTYLLTTDAHTHFLALSFSDFSVSEINIISVIATFHSNRFSFIIVCHKNNFKSISAFISNSAKKNVMKKLQNISAVHR